MGPSMINICLFLIFWTVSTVFSEYPRFKYRGSHPVPKPPPYPQYAKKWLHTPPYHTARPPVRSRPIPVHMPPHHKIPMGVAPSINRPVAVPVRAFWKNTQTTYRTPVEQQYVAAESIVVPKKVFLSSPAIVAQDYNFQIHSNNIPTAYKTIKQIGEKGPIHTIPAPNLSPADKPFRIEEVKPVQRQQEKPVQQRQQEKPVQRQQESTYVQIQKSHQYQVTEAPEQPQKQALYKNYYEQPSTHIQNEAFLNNEASHLGPNEVYQLINAYPQQSQLVETVSLPVLQQQEYLQQFPLLAQQAQILQPQQDIVDQIQKAADKISVQPEYHSFNYEEQGQDRKDVSKKDTSSMVTGGYNLEPDTSASESIQSILGRSNPTDSITQSKYVQNYFDTRDENVNNVEPDAKPSQDEAKDNSETGFYVSLPNKEAAEKLASLQAAGKLNSNLMQMSKKGHENLPVSIYVPDDSAESQSSQGNDNDDEEEEAYEDYSQEDMIPEEVNHQSEDSFGHRLKPKTN